MASYSLNQRTISFTTPVGTDTLLPESLTGTEGISQLFDFDLELLAEAGAVVHPESIVGQKVTVGIGIPGANGQRYFNGIVSSFSRGGSDPHFDTYRARIVPALWVLTLNTNCRIYQNKSVLDIVKSILQHYGLSVRVDAQSTYPPLDYCTQYHETDFQFVSRLMEQNGLFYFFAHTAEDHQLILADGRNSYAPCPQHAAFHYASHGSAESDSGNSLLLTFHDVSTMVAGKHTRWDYDFRDFAGVQTASIHSASDFGKLATNERYDYPGAGAGINSATGSPNQLDADQIRVSAEAEDLTSQVFRGTSNGPSLTPGYTMDVSRHSLATWNRRYLVTQVQHTARQSPSYRTETDPKNAHYSNSFDGLKSDVVFRAPQTTRKPVIAGPQTGVVVGPSGEEIYLDKFGRIKVQFYWDRQGKKDENSSAWLRVAQQWAGKGWGTFFWPRVTDEVIISFLDGDPDHPIVVGSVYNGINMPHEALPDHGTRSGILTRSSKGGSADNANELRFEDKQGNEQIFIHAEKDMETSIENDCLISVGNDDHLHVTKNQKIAIDGNKGEAIGGNQSEKVTGASDRSVGKDLNEKIGGNYSLSSGQNHSHTVGQVFVVDAGQEVHLKGAMKVVIESSMAVCLTGPGGFISIDPSGVTISGMLVKINSGGAQIQGSPATAPSPKDPDKPKEAQGFTGSSGGSSSSGGGGGTSSSSAAAPSASPPSLPGVAALAGSLASQASGQAQSLEAMGQSLASQAGAAAKAAVDQVAAAVKQAESAASAAVEQAQNAAQQAQNAVAQAEQSAMQAAQQGSQFAQNAVNQAKSAAQQAQQQAQQAVAQAQTAAQLAEQQALKAVADAEQQAQQSVQQAEQAAKQAEQQGQQTVQQAQQQAQQAAAQAQAQVTQAAAQAQQAAQQASAQAQQAAAQAQQAAQSAQKAAQNAANAIRNPF